jgi:hypothetical protein
LSKDLNGLRKETKVEINTFVQFKAIGQEYKYLRFVENIVFRKLDLFLSSNEGRETPTLFGPLERANLTRPLFLRGPAKVGSSIFSLEGENRSSFRNAVTL